MSYKNAFSDELAKVEDFCVCDDVDPETRNLRKLIISFNYPFDPDYALVRDLCPSIQDYVPGPESDLFSELKWKQRRFLADTDTTGIFY